MRKKKNNKADHDLETSNEIATNESSDSNLQHGPQTDTGTF